MKRIGSQSRLRALWVAAAALFFALAPARARAVPTIDAELGDDTIALGEQTTYTLTLTDQGGGELTLPRFGDLQVEGPQRTNQSIMTFANGVQSVRTSTIYVWTVEAPREGKFVIGPAILKHNGESYMSNGVELNVAGTASRPRQAQNQRARRGLFGSVFPDDPFDDMDRSGGWGAGVDPWNGRRGGESDVFMRAVVDKPEVYLGEQVTLSLYLFSRADISGVQTVSFPKLDGFWAEDIEAPTQLTAETRAVNGVPYHAYLLRRRALFPLRAGELVVDPVEAQVSLGLQLFFGAQAETVKRKSGALKVNVKPLPADGQPQNFEASNVGVYSLAAQASPTTLGLGQPVQLKVVLEGTGNIKGARVPRPQLPAGLKTYDPTIGDKVRLAGGRYGGTKTLEWVVIPERTGSFTIPPIEMPFFDPTRGEYQVARTEPIQLTITASDTVAAAQPGLGSSAPVAANVLSGGVRPIRLQADLGTRAIAPIWNRGYFWPLAAGPVALWALVWGGGLFVGALRRRDPDKLKVKRAKGQARGRLKAAREKLDASDASGFYAEVTRALQQFVADKTGVAAQGLTRDVLVRTLVDRGFPTRDVQALARLLETCETARFSPLRASKEDLGRLLDEGHRILDALDAVKTTPRAA